MFFPWFRLGGIILALAFWPFVSGREEGNLRKTSLELPAAIEEFRWIRISLMESVTEITVATDWPYRVTDAAGRSLFKGERIVPTRVRAKASGIQMGHETFPGTALTIESKGKGIRLGNRLYHHALKISLETNGKLSVVNEIAIEDYLKGVLPHEVNSKWPAEALKAQAVASRTYALFKAIENKDRKFVLSKDVLSQVYGGKNSETFLTSRAVEETAGEVLTFGRRIFPAYFHSTCGGATTHAEYNWDVEAHPTLKGVDCTFCRGSKHYRWTARLSRLEIERKLSRRGLSVSGIRSIEARERDGSGRARAFRIEHAGGETTLRANDFRLWVNTQELKSVLITSIEADGEDFIFKGRGWGHGVGMCQYGIKYLAELGYGYRQILEYYYPGSEITKITV